MTIPFLQYTQIMHFQDHNFYKYNVYSIYVCTKTPVHIVSLDLMSFLLTKQS